MASRGLCAGEIGWMIFATDRICDGKITGVHVGRMEEVAEAMGSHWTC